MLNGRQSFLECLKTLPLLQSLTLLEAPYNSDFLILSTMVGLTQLAFEDARARPVCHLSAITHLTALTGLQMLHCAVPIHRESAYVGMGGNTLLQTMPGRHEKHLCVPLSNTNMAVFFATDPAAMLLSTLGFVLHPATFRWQHLVNKLAATPHSNDCFPIAETHSHTFSSCGLI